MQVDVHASVGPLEKGGTHETGGSYVRPALASTKSRLAAGVGSFEASLEQAQPLAAASA